MYRTVPKLGEVWRSNDGPKALKFLKQAHSNTVVSLYSAIPHRLKIRVFALG
jgi:hypothetical protein